MAETDQQQAQDVEKKGNMDENQARNLATLCHLGGLLGFLPALIIWLLKKDDSPLIDDQGKEAINFQITMLICFIVSWLLIFVLIGVILLPIVVIFYLIMIIVASVKCSKGESYRYPICIRFLK